MGFTVAVPPVVTHPSAVAPPGTLVNTEDTYILTLTIEADFSICTLCASEHKPWVWHVITQVHMGSTAQNPTSFLKWDIRFYGNSIGTNDWPAGTSLTLDFSTLSIPQLTFGKGTLGVFATVAIRVTCRVDSLEADPRGRFSTWSPERDALLFMCLTDAVVAVTIHPLARVPIVQVHVGWALGADPCAELREVTGVAGAPARRPRRLQLAVLTAQPVCAYSFWLQGTGGGVAAEIHAFLWLPTVTLFSFFDISVPTLWAPKRLLNFWQVEEAHAHAFLQAGLQVLPAAAAEHHGEGVPCGGVHDAAPASFVSSHSAATASLQGVMVHPEVVAQLVCQGHSRTKGAV